MNRNRLHWLCCLSLLVAASCVNATDTDGTTTLRGTVLDWNEAPVADAEVLLVIGAEPVTGSVITDAQGRYALPNVPAADVVDAYFNGNEISLLIYSDNEDLAPYGTAEGDRVHLTPLSLDEFVGDISELLVNEEVDLRTGYVPLQEAGYAITPELITEGGELTWHFDESPIGSALDVTLIIAPGSIRLTSDEYQREITLTPIDTARAPMAIPDGGAGVIWTIQPRDVMFDPPARVRVSGDRLSLLGMTESEVGTTFTVFGASLEDGWAEFGPVEVKGIENNVVTLESTEGIIRRGAWGHVFSGTYTDAGTLISCYDRDSGAPIPCAVFDDNYDLDGDALDDQTGWVSLTQVDYQNQHRAVYYTDMEPVCSGCTNNGAPYSQLAFGLNLCARTPGCDPAAPAPVAGVHNIWLKAARLDCIGLDTETDITTRDSVIESFRGNGEMPGQWWQDLDDYSSTGDVEIGVAYRNFSYQATFNLKPCPADT